MRRVVALVEVDGQEREMVFLTNNLEWSPRSVVDLYRCRWQIEVFFKQIKQTLQLADFLGTQRQRRALAGVDGPPGLCAVALLELSVASGRIASPGSSLCLRAALWQKLDLLGLLGGYGTADGSFRYLARPEQAYLPGFL